MARRGPGAWQRTERLARGGGEAEWCGQSLGGLGTPLDGLRGWGGAGQEGRGLVLWDRGVLAGEGRRAGTSEGRARGTDGAFIFLLKSFQPS